ncbi:MAG: hypothetical protein KF696_07280 [Planctomycetes bacterium]|nr:hypothetical protein [Planctomycetota bacterium]MCW8135352.1 hypothetical protein [Planctomycetota bacterium]
MPHLGRYWFGASLALLTLFVSYSPAVAQDDKLKLAWSLPDRTCLHYASELAPKPETGDVPEIGQQGGIQQDTPAMPRRCEAVTLFGYEIDERGVRRPGFSPQTFEQAVLQAAWHLPKGVTKPGATYKAAFSHAVNLNRIPPAFASQYEVVGLEEVTGFGLCARIRGSHLMQHAQTGKAAERWETLTVTTEAWFHIEGGCLARCDAVVKGQLLKKEGAEVHDRLQWRLTQRFDSRERASLERRSEEALIKGLEYIWSVRGKDGTFNSHYRTRGGTALALLTLLNCGVRHDDPRIMDSFRALNELPLDRTYQAAATCMAYEALLIRRRQDHGKPDATLTRAEMTELERVAGWIINNRNKPNDLWGYTPAPDGRWFQISIVEWVLMGLAAAQRAGVVVPLDMIKRISEQLLSLQADKGEPVKRVVSGEFRANGNVRVTRNNKPAMARGFTYDRKVGSGADANAALPYASATCAAVNALANCLEIARNADKAARQKEFADTFGKWKDRIVDAVSDGLAWLEVNYSVSCNIGERHAICHGYHYFAYLHSLERTCTFAEADWIGEHNWYDEARAALLVNQRERGNWQRYIMETMDTVEDTCFAVLVLKKNILKPRWPVFTQKEAE